MADITLAPGVAPSSTAYTYQPVGSKGEIRVDTGPVTITPSTTGPSAVYPGGFLGFLLRGAEIIAPVVGAGLLAAGGAVAGAARAASVGTGTVEHLSLVGGFFPNVASPPFWQSLGTAITGAFPALTPIVTAVESLLPSPGVPGAVTRAAEQTSYDPTAIPSPDLTIAGLSSLGFPTGGGTMLATLGGALVRAFPALEAVVPKILIGTSIGSAVYTAYKAFRAAGQPHKTARRSALASAGVHLKRRRMRSTNIRALRRAIRRVHGFKRVARKVGALGVTARGRLMHHAYPRRRRRIYRRGDVDPFITEDTLDMIDEWEDEGGDPDMFPNGSAPYEEAE